jgi:hypothetical protein
MLVTGQNAVQGRARLHRVTGDCWTPVTDFKSNLVLYQWTEIVSKLLTTGDSRYRIGGMYLEFKNVASPGTTVSPPSFTRARTVAYYDALASSPDTDYLRVPLTATQILSEGEGLTNNQLVFFARSSGMTGVHGKSFSYASNSVVFGASLVAFVDATDTTQDLLYSSIYFATEDQQQKLATSQIGLEWPITLG